MMAPDAGDCEEERLNSEDHRTGAPLGRRVVPELIAPTQAWVENEDERTDGSSQSNSPGECRRLLGSLDIPPLKPKSRIQAGLTLGVWEVSKKHAKCPITPKILKPKVKTSFQKKKEKLISALKPPYFILFMIVVILGVHLLGSDELRAQLDWSPGPWWHQPWRLVTYGCLHATTAHLLPNVIVAVSVGWRLEHEQGWWRAACVWAGGAAGGALGAGALQPHVRVVGASAAVYALLTAHLPNVCLRRGHIPLWWFRPLSVVVLATSEATWTLWRTYVLGAESQNIAWAAHVFGATVGVPIAFIVFTGENKTERYIFMCRVVSMTVLMAGVAIAAVYYSVFYDVDE